MEPDPQHLVVPREIIAFPPGEETIFSPADYPWLVAMRAHLKGGDVAGEDRAAGKDGYVVLELYDQDPSPDAA